MRQTTLVVLFFCVFYIFIFYQGTVSACTSHSYYPVALYVDTADVTKVANCIQRIVFRCKAFNRRYLCINFDHCQACSPQIFFSKKANKIMLQFIHYSPNVRGPNGYVSFKWRYLNLHKEDRPLNFFSLVKKKDLEQLESRAALELSSSPVVLFCPNAQDVKNLVFKDIEKGLTGKSFVALLRSLSLLRSQPATKNLLPYLKALIHLSRKPYWFRYQKAILEILVRIASQKREAIEQVLQKLPPWQKTPRLLLAASLIQVKAISPISVKLLKEMALDKKSKERRLLALKTLSEASLQIINVMPVFIRALREKDSEVSSPMGRYIFRVLERGVQFKYFLLLEKIGNLELHWSMLSFILKREIHFRYFPFVHSLLESKINYSVKNSAYLAAESCLQVNALRYLMKASLEKAFHYYLSYLSSTHAKNQHALTVLFARKGAAMIPFLKKEIYHRKRILEQRKYLQILLFLLIEEQREKQALSLLLSSCDEILPEHVDSFLRIFGMIRGYGLWPVFHPRLEQCFLHHLQKQPREVFSHIDGLEKHLFFAVPKLLNWLELSTPKEQADWFSERVEKIVLFFGKRSLPLVQLHLYACKSSYCKEKVDGLLLKIKKNNKKATPR